ncbi:hypothetical protein FRC01_010482, partial [Tulasnella sp. 417]
GPVPSDCFFGAGPIVPPNVEHTISYQPISMVEAVVIQVDVDEGLRSLNDRIPFDRALTKEKTKKKGIWKAQRCLWDGRKPGYCRVSEGTGSEFTYTFSGPMITIWGALENVNSLYTVSIDGSEPKLYRPPSNISPEPIVALAHASNLGPGRHTITVRSVPEDGKSRIEIDGAESMTDFGAQWLPKPTSDTRNPFCRKL